jgi:transposase
VTQAVARAARRVQPTYQALVGGVQASPVVAPDETGWRVGGRRAWLWAFAGQGIVAYRIARGRGFQDAAAVLGAGYGGVLERDGGRRTASSPRRPPELSGAPATPGR